jgi:hypothetical protein
LQGQARKLAQFCSTEVLFNHGVYSCFVEVSWLQQQYQHLL